VINPRSFPVQTALDKILKEIKDCFADPEGEDYSTLISRYPRNAISLIRKQVKELRPDETVRVYAVGGDGILFDCLNGIVGLPNIELAAVPYGMANDFIRTFGEDKKALFRDIRLQITSPAILTDIIHCGNNYALNFCTVGMESDAIMSSMNIYGQLSQDLRKFHNINYFVYVTLFYLSGAKAAFNKKVLKQFYKINVDGKDFSGNYASINIANGPCYGGNMNPVITAMPNDGWLDVIFFKHSSIPRTAGLISKFTKGEFRRYPDDFIFKRLRKIEIQSEDPLFVDLDGEVFFDTSLEVEIIPQAVKIVAPGGIEFLKRADINE
jgi:YegS/Rv2252/BmrU family lipid kinase